MHSEIEELRRQVQNLESAREQEINETIEASVANGVVSESSSLCLIEHMGSENLQVNPPGPLVCHGSD